MKEFWDIYDENRCPTGKTHQRGLPLAVGEYHLVVHIWVQNSSGDFFITQRAPDKSPFPGKWECTGGSALAGEDSEAAALRETREETGIDHTNTLRKRVLSYRKQDWFGDVWLFRTDFPVSRVRLQAEETVACMWASRQLILDLVKSGDFCPYDYIEQLLSQV